MKEFGNNLASGDFNLIAADNGKMGNRTTILVLLLRKHYIFRN
jgi:hypothetical protein